MTAACIKLEKLSLPDCPSTSIKVKADQYEDPPLVFGHISPPMSDEPFFEVFETRKKKK
jgi:hypothetical protein